MTKKNNTFVIVVGLALVGLLAMLVATRLGIGVYPDSTIYFDAAHNLANGRGLIVISGTGNEPMPLTHYPPMYSSLLALATTGGITIETAARLVNALLFGANIALVGISIAFLARNSFWLPLTGSFLTLTAPDMLEAHSVALTEPLYLFLTFGGLLSLARYLQNRRRRFLLAASIAIALSCMARYVGVVGIATGIIALLFLNRSGSDGVPLPFSFGSPFFRRRVIDTVIFAVVSCLPLGLWSIKNHFSTGDASDRQFAFHPIKFQQIVPAFSTASQWLLVGKVRGDIRFLVFIIEMLVLASLTVYLMMKRRTSGGYNTHGEEERSKLPRLLVIFMMTYVAFLVFTISFLETDNVLDSRALLPVHFAALVLAPCLAGSLYRRAKSKAIGVAFVSLAMLLAGSYTFRGARWLAQVQADGQGYAGRAWKESPTVSQIKKLPSDIPIYSNGVDAIYYLTGRHAIYIPSKVIHGAGTPNLDYDRDNERMKNDLRERRGVVIYFKTFPERSFFPTEREFTERLPMRLLAAESDGSIYSPYDR